MFAANFGTGQVFLEILYFFLFLIWLWLLIVVFTDIFRSSDLGGWAKAFWVFFVIVLPYLGVLVYLIARGSQMHERAMQARAAQDAAMRQYIRDAMKDTTP
jgi:Phospholipase_D-nuclease N-terminal